MSRIEELLIELESAYNDFHAWKVGNAKDALLSEFQRMESDMIAQSKHIDELDRQLEAEREGHR